jgi:hypothetical protein
MDDIHIDDGISARYIAIGWRKQSSHARRSVVPRVVVRIPILKLAKINIPSTM